MDLYWLSEIDCSVVPPHFTVARLALAVGALSKVMLGWQPAKLTTVSGFVSKSTADRKLIDLEELGSKTDPPTQTTC